MKNETSTFPLRLPRSLRTAVTELAKKEGISANQLVTIAVAEKLSAVRTADFFAERTKGADVERFRRILRRGGGETPRAGDELK
jgi:hypothetical protein